METEKKLKGSRHIERAPYVDGDGFKERCNIPQTQHENGDREKRPLYTDESSRGVLPIDPYGVELESPWARLVHPDRRVDGDRCVCSGLRNRSRLDGTGDRRECVAILWEQSQERWSGSS